MLKDYGYKGKYKQVTLKITVLYLKQKQCLFSEMYTKLELKIKNIVLYNIIDNNTIIYISIFSL